MTEDQVSRVRALFDLLADDYDQSGVAFFAPIAARLLDAVALRPGERLLDLGCGRGAVALPAAALLGPGRVVAADLSPAMVEHTRRAAEDADLGVRCVVTDAMDPEVGEDGFDALTASLVLFFLPDPVSALRRWADLLRPGGRLGVTTFGDYSPTWEAVDALFVPFLPPGMRDPRITGVDSPFVSDAGVEGLLTSAGLDDVRTVVTSLEVAFDDPTTWRRWSMSTGQRAMWAAVPDDERDRVADDATALLESARDADGVIRLRQDVRCTVGRVADSGG